MALRLPVPNFEGVLGRRQWALDLEALAAPFRGRRVLVTGGEGSLGGYLADVLAVAGAVVWNPDVDRVDVTDRSELHRFAEQVDPAHVLHVAGLKHAPDGELDPAGAFDVNVAGTANVLEAMPRAHVTLTSTCKAITPETTYGATKLLAERLVLNAGGSVARLYNVVDTSGNVFSIWREIPDEDPIPVTTCRRFFITAREAAALILHAAVNPGRWTIDPGDPRWMVDVARAAYPGRRHVAVPPRRGDRIEEPRIGPHEWIYDRLGPFEQVIGSHDLEGALP